MTDSHGRTDLYGRTPEQRRQAFRQVDIRTRIEDEIRRRRETRDRILSEGYSSPYRQDSLRASNIQASDRQQRRTLKKKKNRTKLEIFLKNLTPKEKEKLKILLMNDIAASSEDILIFPNVPKKNDFQGGGENDSSDTTNDNKDDKDDNEINAFKCPITYSQMESPYIDMFGHSYEKEAISTWLKNNNTSPLTGLEYPLKILFKNRNLENAIKEFESKSKSGGGRNKKKTLKKKRKRRKKKRKTRR